MDKWNRFPIIPVLIWGGLWGIFEATVGYALHLLPIRIGWLIWYPVACFFMMNVYLCTQRIAAIIAVGVLAGCVKLVNLLLPISIDRVINPSVSILFEALAIGAVVWVGTRYFQTVKWHLVRNGLMIVLMNTGWRLLYALYLWVIVPDWMREISVIASASEVSTFLVTHNLATCTVLLVGTIVWKHWATMLNCTCAWLDDKFTSVFANRAMYAKYALAICLVLSSMAFEVVL